MFEVGDVVGSYTILAPLRSGGMADLFLARRDGAAGFRRLVAIKVVHSRHAEDDQLVRMFLDEALISARIDHPNVVHVEDLGELDDTYFLVMEYVHGCSLAQLMKVLGGRRRRLSPTVAVAIAARVAEGLHSAHETTDDEGALVQLVHRDVSPQNILLSHKGHVKLIDFGVAKAELRSQQTNVATLKGKVRYMPPEQATTGEVDRRSDVYSLGIVLWEMLTMRRLFAGKTEFEVLLRVRDPEVVPPSQYVSDISPELDRVVLAALSKDPDERPRSAKLFRRMLARAEPRAMALDSAHLADLVSSVVGEELEERRHRLPQEISKLLEAEQLRAALAAAESEGQEERTESAVEIMTLHSDMVQFEEDELDDTPDAVVPPAEPMTRPGGPIALSRSGEMSPPRLGALSSEEAAAMDLPTMEDADPTMVGDRPPGLRRSMATHIPHDEDSENIPTHPLRRELSARGPEDEPSHPPRLGVPVLAPPAVPVAQAPIGGAPERIPRSRSMSWLAIVLAVLVSAAFGTLLALLWPSGDAREAERGAEAAVGPAPFDVGGGAAAARPAPPDAGPPAPPDAGPPAPPDAGLPRVRRGRRPPRRRAFRRRR